MKEALFKLDPGAEYYFEEGCFINELSNSSGDEAVSIARARLEPGKATRWHYLTVALERYVILEGEGVVEVGDMPVTLVGSGDVVIIPEGCRQRITNSGSSDLVFFLAICSPRFKPEYYVDCDEC